MKSCVLLYKASPIFNRNPDYSGFKNTDETALVDTNYDENKWKETAENAKSALDTAEAASVKLYDCSTNTSLIFADNVMKAKNNYNVSGDVAQPQIVADRNFPSEKYSLWPISITEMQKNKNLVQTDGW